MDNSGQPISDKWIVDTIIGNRITTKSFDSTNEYVKRTMLNNEVFNTFTITSFYIRKI